MLAGTVIEIAGETRTTDENGRVSFIVPAAFATVAAVLPGALNSPPSIATVRPAMPTAAINTAAPTIAKAPSNPTPGLTMKISGEGFSGETGGNTVKIGAGTTEVLASSPAEIVTIIPTDAEVGPQSPWTPTAPTGIKSEAIWGMLCCLEKSPPPTKRHSLFSPSFATFSSI